MLITFVWQELPLIFHESLRVRSSQEVLTTTQRGRKTVYRVLAVVHATLRQCDRDYDASACCVSWTAVEGGSGFSYETSVKDRAKPMEMLSSRLS